MVTVVELMTVGLNWLGTSQLGGIAQLGSINQPIGNMAILASQATIGCGICGTTCGSTCWTFILGVPWFLFAKNHHKIKRTLLIPLIYDGKSPKWH